MTPPSVAGRPVDGAEGEAGRRAAVRRAGPAHARGTGRRWRLLVVGVLVAAVAAVVALLLAQSAGAVHLSVLGVTPFGGT